MNEKQFPAFESAPVSITMQPEKKEYIPPVGPGSKSVPPAGDFRDLPPGIIPAVPRPPKK